MAIYSRSGLRVRIQRPVTTLRAVANLERRQTDDHDKQRLQYGMYAVVTFPDEPDLGEQMIDLGLLRADGGIQEINKEAKAVGCLPR